VRPAWPTAYGTDDRSSVSQGQRRLRRLHRSQISRGGCGRTLFPTPPTWNIPSIGCSPLARRHGAPLRWTVLPFAAAPTGACVSPGFRAVARWQTPGRAILRHWQSETDKHGYEGLTRVSADAVLAGSSTVRGRRIVFSVWHPELVRLRQAFGQPRHLIQIIATHRGVPVDRELLSNVPELVSSS
jgi:hypothetical protein